MPRIQQQRCNGSGGRVLVRGTKGWARMQHHAYHAGACGVNVASLAGIENDSLQHGALVERHCVSCFQKEVNLIKEKEDGKKTDHG